MLHNRMLMTSFWSYLSTAAKWGISKLGALRDLFKSHAWMPPGLEPFG